MLDQDRIAKKFSQTENTLNNLEAKAVKEMNKVFKAALAELVLNLEKTYPKYLKGETLATIRAKFLIQELAEYMVLFNPKSEKTIQKQLDQLIKAAYAQGIELGNFEMQELDKGVASFNPTPVSLGTKPMVEAASFVIKNSMDRLKNYSMQFSSEASSLLALNLTLGVPVKKTAAQIRDRFSIAQSKAVTIARTETMSALNEASTFVAKQNGLDAVQFFATEDKDTCPYCLGRNQRIYKIDDIKVPLHPRCRCFLQPFSTDWVDSEGEVFDAQWSRDYYYSAKGNRPTITGAAPFEKMAGLEPPEAIWSPTEKIKWTPAPKAKGKPPDATTTETEEYSEEEFKALLSGAMKDVMTLPEEEIEESEYTPLYYVQHKKEVEQKLKKADEDFDKLMSEALANPDLDLNKLIEQATGLMEKKVINTNISKPKKGSPGSNWSEDDLVSDYLVGTSPYKFGDWSKKSPLFKDIPKEQLKHPEIKGDHFSIKRAVPTLAKVMKTKEVNPNFVVLSDEDELIGMSEITGIKNIDKLKELKRSLVTYTGAKCYEIVADERAGRENIHAKNINEYLKSVKPEHRYQGRIYRGMSFDSPHTHKFIPVVLEALEKGTPTSSLQSFSSSYVQSIGFMGKGRGVLLSLKENVSGTSIMHTSQFSEEQEVLMPTGTKIRMTEVGRAAYEEFKANNYEGQVVIEVEEID